MPAEGFTERDMQILAMAMQCLPNPEAMKLDYKKLATLGGYKTPASANASWLMVKKKLLAATGTIGTPKNASPEEGENDALADDEATPIFETPKKQRGGRKPKAGTTNAGAQPDDSEGLNGTPTPKKRGRKPSNSTGGPAAKRAKKDVVKKEEKADSSGDENDNVIRALIKNEPDEVNAGSGAEGNGEDNHALADTNAELEGEGEFQQQMDLIGV